MWASTAIATAAATVASLAYLAATAPKVAGQGDAHPPVIGLFGLLALVVTFAALTVTGRRAAFSRR